MTDQEYLQSLKTELTTDPVAVGYSTAVAAGDCVSLRAEINSLTGKGAATITLTSLTHDQFLVLLLPALAALENLSTAIQNKWTPFITLAESVQGVVALTAQVIGFINSAVPDGVLTTVQAQAFYQRTGARAEVLYGQDFTVSADDCGRALRV